MLQKFKAVEEIGRFSNLTHRAEPFAKLSLVFSRNGYGKSTLCSILRSAAEGKPEYIKARRRLGALNDSRVESVWASGATIAYSVGKWNGCPGKIHIFDQEYISKNLHIGDSVTRDNKRSLLPVVLGDHGVALANKVLALNKEQRETDDKRKEQSHVLLARCKGMVASDVVSFCNTEAPDDLASKMRAAGQRVELMKQAAIVKQKKNPPQLPLEDLADFEALLCETLDGVSENAAQLVARHIETHQLGERAQGWLEYGTAHAPQDHCPYCAQRTNGLPLVAAYRAYFSEAFKALKARMDELWDAVSVLSAAKLDELITANDVDFIYWSKFCDLGTLPTLSPTDRASIADGLSNLKTLVEAKRQSPLELVDLSRERATIRPAVAQLVAYNERIATCGIEIDQARADTAEGDLQKAESIYGKWLALAEKAHDPVKSAAAAYTAAQTRLDEIKVEKSSAQANLTNYTATTMAGQQMAVNELLSDFGANFRIIDAKTNFVGREPNTEFAIEIGGYRVKAGDKSDTEPSFKTVLSAGDKTTLALAFFIAQIEADSTLKSAIVVFDDPFSSQDMDRQFQTTSHIRSVCSKACQTIVMSHDPRFLQLIEKNADSAQTRTFQLQCSDSGEGYLQKWSSTGELKSLYIQQPEVIREYASHGTLLKGQTLNGVKQSIRPFIEDYLRLRFPGRFVDQAQISEMASGIKDAGTADPLAGSVADLFALNEYTRPNMHGGGDQPVSSELRVHCRKIVAIVGSY